MGDFIALAGPFDARPWIPRADRIHGDAPSLLGGGGSPVCLLAEAMEEDGEPLLVVTLDPGLRDEVILEGPGFRICVGPCRPRSRERWLDAFAQERSWVRRILERERPCLVHAHWTYEYALGALDSGLPHLITAHDAPWVILKHQLQHHPRGFPYRALRTALAYQALRRAQHLTAVSQYVVDHIQRFGFTRRPISVIPNGLPDRWFRNIETSRPIYPITTFVAILNGGFSGLKNGPTLLRAFAHLHAYHPETQLVLFGAESGTGEEAQRMAKKLGCDKGIDFRGVSSHEGIFDSLANEADVLVHPSLHESFGMTILEAMAQGLPVVAGRASGGVSEVVQDGQTGFLVDVVSYEAMAQAMAKLHQEPTLRSSLGQAAQRRCRETFHIQAVLASYRALYAQILSQPCPRQAGNYP